jgi:serine/threonine-protein kinase SRPK3
MPPRRRHQPGQKIYPQKQNKKNVKEKEKELDDDSNNWRGHIIHNKDEYVLINQLGIGSYASVWMCYGTNKKKLYAMKIFNKDAKRSGKKEQDIYNKFEKLLIRNIVVVHDKFMRGERLFIVFDLMIGSLYDMIDKDGGCMDKLERRSFKSGFPIDFVIKITKSILETLSDLHEKGIVHGDVKPENILLEGRNNFHISLIESLTPKSSTKKISDTIKELCKDIVINKKEGSTNSESDNGSDNSGKSEPDVESEDSVMSKLPEPIELSDDESDNQTKSNNSSDVFTDDKDDVSSINKLNKDDTDEIDGKNKDDTDEKKIEEEELEALSRVSTKKKDDKKKHEPYLIDIAHIKDPIVKLADLGSCVELSADKKPLYLQTKYYKAPEIILGIGYDGSCDIWALGCTIYELLTGSILFDPDNYENVDKKRTLLHQMYARIGRIPKELIEKSPSKQVFFTENFILKENYTYGNELYEENVWMNLLQHMDCDTIKKYLLLDLILDMLKLDYRRRITAKDALEHPIFEL